MKAETPVERRRSLFPTLVLVCTTVALSFYLFATAPPELAAPATEPASLPIRDVFAILQAENQAARTLWTQEIVEHGKRVGLAFDERWRDPTVEAGPLPALFLRETAAELERSETHLGLFLGSRFPIRAANGFGGAQQQHFALLESTGVPQGFFDASTDQHTAMFPDRAVADACAECHNAHPDSPKHDWHVGELMGATTWMYPDAQVSVQRALELLGSLRASIRATYRHYLAKTATFRRAPAIGSRWPRDGFYLPTDDAFMRELVRRTSESTLRQLLDPTGGPTATLPAGPIAVPAAAAPSDRLVIRTQRATRITVEHAGHRLLVARLPADGITELRSPLPLRISVGDPEGLEVEYDGKKVEVPTTRSSDDLEDVSFVLGAERS